MSVARETIGARGTEWLLERNRLAPLVDDRTVSVHP
jgi:hypothetical protein